MLSTELVDGIWTATEISAVHHQSGHKTLFRYREVSYPETLEGDLFSADALARRLPASLTSY